MKNSKFSYAVGICASVLALVAGFSIPAQADDRDLLRASSVKPYVFVILDTSGSMNLSPPCSATDFGAGKCGFLCPGGDCFVPRNADDPASKFRQAREALSEVIDNTSNVFWGFASYNQDDVLVSNKHWLYTVSNTQPSGFFSLPPSSPPANSWTQYPKAGAEEVFGATVTCTSVNNTGCSATSPATLPNFSAAPNYALEKVRRYPKGATNADTVVYWIQDNNVATLSGFNKIFRVSYQLTGASTLGNATVQATVSIARCKNTTCSAASDFTAISGSPKVMNFDLVGDFLMVDSGSGTNTKPSGVTTNYFTAEDVSVGNTCSGWEPNTDSTSDDNGSSYNLKITTVGTSPRDYGDVTPLDWDHDNKTTVRSRLAPDGTALNAGESYTTSQYFRNTRSGSETFLRLLDDNRHTLVSNGSTPIGNSMNDFRLWYTGSRTGTTSKTGWRGAAIANDKNWTCRKVYLIFITDGMDTCGGSDPCQQAADLLTGYDTKTYAIAFGQTTNANVTCMADKGGTGSPIFPTNKQALVDALNGILSSIREDSAAFASAAVPSVQAQVADKVYLTNFSPVNPDDPLKPPATNSPLNASSIWVGHIQAYLKPLPVDPLTGVVSDTLCTSGQKSRCLAWDSFTAMKTQAPTQTSIATDKQIGLLGTNRRVYYSDGGAITTGGAVNTQVPLTRKLFLPPAVADRLDLWQGMGIANSGSGDATALATSNAVIDFTLEQKHTQIVREIPIAGHPNPEDVDYILGDIFHSNPVVLNNPGNFRYFMRDVGRGSADSSDCRATTNVNHGYQCFFERHRCRRRMLFVGSNDGQLHAIDAGIFSVADTNNHNLLQCNDLNPANINTTLQEPIGFFDNGTGKEIFSYIPRPALAKLKQYKDTGKQDWSVDGTPVADDVFIDPAHNGTPTAADREWRTVLLGGMREGGNSYFALDVTQPDTYDSLQVPQPNNVYVPSCANTVSGCGPTAFPTALWEFSDLNDEDVDGQPGSTHPDLAKTWSTPNIGRIRVCEGANCDPNSPTNNLVDKYVAVFGGGLDGTADTTSPNFSAYGNWLYMVDIETGRAIYKRQLDGAAPSEPAAVDVNQDGYLDTIYIGTTTGFMYKVDLSTVPQLLNQTVSYWSCTTDPCATGSPKPAAITRTEKRIVDTAWTPFKIFNTGGRPIYYPPTVVFVGQLGQYALGFGTGNRENLWATDGVAGRFYMITDTGFTRAMALAGTLPLVESSYPLLNPASAAATRDYIINPDTAGGMRSGWVMQLDANERVISNAFSLSGITVFTGYTPTTGIDPALGNLCSKGGDSRIFTVLTTTADAVMKSGSTPVRFVLKDNFVTNPFTEQSQTKNASASDQQGQQLTSDQQALFDKLKTLFPQNCKFSNFRVDIKTVRADTKLVLIAPVPVCIVQKNWKEY